MEKLDAVTRIAATAHHEAGHAVVALHHGRSLRKVSIEPGLDYLGVCKSSLGFGKSIEYRMTDRARRLIEEEIKILLAGEIAHRNFSEKSWSPTSSSSDRKCAYDLIVRLACSAEESQAYMTLLEIQAKQFVLNEAIWGQITTLAQALLTRRTMGQKEVMDLLALIRIKPSRELKAGLEQLAAAKGRTIIRHR